MSSSVFWENETWIRGRFGLTGGFDETKEKETLII